MKKILSCFVILVISLTALVSCVITPSGDGHRYNYFSSGELSLIDSYFDFEIPFAPSNEYYLNEIDQSTGEEQGLNYYTVGNTEEEFNAYLLKIEEIPGAVYSGSQADSHGDVWYFYSVSDVCIDIAYYLYEGEYLIDCYFYISVQPSDPDDPGSTDPDDPAEGSDYIYNSFTETDLETLNSLFDIDLPFIPTNDYYVNYFSDETYTGINYYTLGNTEAEFQAFLALLEAVDGVVFYDTEIDDAADTWYLYDYGDSTFIDVAYYYYDGANVIDVYIYFETQSSSDSADTPSTDYTYNSFTSAELALIASYFDFKLPFLPTNEYYIEEFSDNGEVGINFYTFGNTQAEFDAYRSAILAISGAEFSGTADSEGDTWYLYDIGDVYIDMAYYYYESEYVVDIYVYMTDDGSGSGSGSGGSSNPDSLITNDFAGMPAADGGVYDVVFTDAIYVRNVTEHGYYLDGCPTTGSPAVLVIPVDFSDRTASACGYSLDVLRDVLMGETGETDYYSLDEYYYISSYGQLDLDITLLDFWFRPKNNSSFYKNYSMYYAGETVYNGEQLILDEALAYLEPLMDLSKFDSDGNGTIDSVILVNTMNVSYDSDFTWAFRFWNIYSDSNNCYYTYDDVFANDYIWMPFSFIYSRVNDSGSVEYDDTTVKNPYTLIHEFGHVLGADDYYDTSEISEPMAGLDVMDMMTGDHNPFTKINFGWITTSRLIVADESITLDLEAFSKSGDTIIIAANWDPKLGAYQEYFIIMYYTMEGLNGEEYGYFERDGIVVYHVNASLFTESLGSDITYNIYNNNTHVSAGGTEENLIEFALSQNNTYTHVVGDRSSHLAHSNGADVEYIFTVDSMTDTKATLTFTKTK